MTITTQADAKTLFQVRLIKKVFSTRNGVKNPDEELILLADAERLEYYKRYDTWYTVLESEELGALWPKGAVVQCLGHSSPYRCYTRASYKIASPTPLNDNDLDILRAQGCFMGGQVEGACNLDKFERDGELYVYTAESVCDSGD